MPQEVIFDQVDLSHDECGVSILSGTVEGERDGESMGIKIKDYTTSTCFYFAPVPDTEVQVEQVSFDATSSEYISTIDLFTGDALN